MAKRAAAAAAEKMPVESRPSPLPRQFGRYQILRELGKGAMGAVYLADDTQLQRQVALKVPRQSTLEDPETLERFYREARIAAQLRHSHICPVYDVGEIDGIHYLTMAYIPGTQMGSLLEQPKLPTPRFTATMFRKLALALHEAHRMGITHRDLKPSNVMLDDRGEPIVMDFGLARNADSEGNARLTQTGAILGTPAYMSPEQVRGEQERIGPLSDVYALGVMLYQFLAGELPFNGPVMKVLSQVTDSEPEPPSTLNPDADPTLEQICLKMMAKDPARRYGNMRDVAAALVEFLKPPSGKENSEPKSTQVPQRTTTERPATAPSTSVDKLTTSQSPAESLAFDASRPSSSPSRLQAVTHRRRSRSRRLSGIVLAATAMGALTAGVMLFKLGLLPLRTERATSSEQLTQTVGRNATASPPPGSTPPKIPADSTAPALMAAGETSLRDGAVSEQRGNTAPNQTVATTRSESPVQSSPSSGKSSQTADVATENVAEGSASNRTLDDESSPLAAMSEPGATEASEMEAEATSDTEPDRPNSAGAPKPGTDATPLTVAQRIAEALAKAQEAFRKETERDKALVIEGLEKREEIARKEKKQSLLEEIAIERQNFLRDGDFPHLLADTSKRKAKDLRRSMLTSHTNLEKAYIKAVNAYKKAGMTADAERLKKEADEFADAADVKFNWTRLINGRDLTGWQQFPGDNSTWFVENGILTSRGKGYLFTRRDNFTNFRLKAETRVTPKGDSGIFVRCKNSKHFPTGIEIEIFPETTGNITSWMNDLINQRAGVRGPTTAPSAWAKLDITVTDGLVTVAVNGNQVSRHLDPERKYVRGHIAIQALYGDVSIRRMMIRED